MVPTDRWLRRWFAGRSVAAVLAVLVAGSVLLGGVFVPAYLAILFASGLRNVYLPWLGNGVAFHAVAVGGLYLQAVLLAGLYRAARHVCRALRAYDGRAAV